MTMRTLKSHPILGLANSYLVDGAQPSSLSYLWNFGSLLGMCLVIQIITGVLLAMHYTPHVDLAFISVEHIIRDVGYGWLIRYTHANTASLFFAMVYAHVARGLFYGSYRSPRVLPWSIGVVILIIMILTAFLGYCLVYGQMSLWGATVITSMLSALPWVGTDLTQLVWGGFSVSNATLNRFYSLHFLFPFLLAGLAAVHMLALHEHGSSNPLGLDANDDRVPIAPYFLFKDLVTILALAFVLMALVAFTPNALGHSDNYIEANPLVTPASIVPEWYLLPFYAILRSIPNKLLGVIAMLAALLAFLTMPIVDTGRTRGSRFRPLTRAAFWGQVTVFVLLLYLGACHVASPWIEVGQVATVLYFAWFLVGIPVAGALDNLAADLAVSAPALSVRPSAPRSLGQLGQRSYSSSPESGKGPGAPGRYWVRPEGSEVPIGPMSASSAAAVLGYSATLLRSQFSGTHDLGPVKQSHRDRFSIFLVTRSPLSSNWTQGPGRGKKSTRFLVRNVPKPALGRELAPLFS